MLILLDIGDSNVVDVIVIQTTVNCPQGKSSIISYLVNLYWNRRY